MGTKTYSEKLKSPKWQKRRLEILSRDNFTCTICGDTETELHVHHEKYIGEPWDAPDDCLKTTCKKCHEKEHKIEEPPTKNIIHNSDNDPIKKYGVPELDNLVQEIRVLQLRLKNDFNMGDEELTGVLNEIGEKQIKRNELLKNIYGKEFSIL